MSSVNCTKLCKQDLITLFMCNLFGMQANRSFLVEIVMKFNPITGGFSGINCTPFSGQLHLGQSPFLDVMPTASICGL